MSQSELLEISSIVLEDQHYNEFHTFIFRTLIGNIKAIPLQAWTGPEGSSRLRLPDFKTVGT